MAILSTERVPAYFSHSYRYQDRDINEHFWRLFWEHGFTFTVDPKSTIFSAPYLELMMKRSACYAAVITKRNYEYYQCSPFVLYEYGLAVQAQKPRLVFVEAGVSGRYFPPGPTVRTFNRNMLEARSGEFGDAISQLAEQSRPYHAMADQLLGKAGLLLGPVDGPYAAVLPRIRRLLEAKGYTAVEVDLRFKNNIEFALALDDLDFVLADVGEGLLPSWAFPLITGRFVPSIKLLELPGGGRERDRQLGDERLFGPLVWSELAKGLPAADEPVIYWRDPEDLFVKLERHLDKLATERTYLRSLDTGCGYFRSLDRPAARTFISNANDANAFAKRLCNALALENIPFFHYQFNNTLDLGAVWEKELLREVAGSQIFLALVTSNYRSSEWSWKEYQYAQKRARTRRIKVIPYFLENVRVADISHQGHFVANLPADEQVKTIIEDLNNVMRTKEKVNDSNSRTRTRRRTMPVDVAIMTVLPQEYQAVRKQLENITAPPLPRNARNLHGWELGEIKSPNYEHPYRAVLAMVGRAGNTTGAVAVMNTIDRFQPSYVLLVGIAGGREVESLKKGDVVVSDQIWGYEYGKVINGRFEPRLNYIHQSDSALRIAADVLDIRHPDWRSAVTEEPPEGECSSIVRTGVVASGEKVVDDVSAAFFKSVLDKWDKIMAIEMEGLGAATAVQNAVSAGLPIGFCMIRGISDIPQSRARSERAKSAQRGATDDPTQTEERDTWKPYASDAAGAFATQLIRLGWPKAPINAS